MAYNGTIKVIAGLKQANNGDFPIVDSSAVRVDDNTRLDEKLSDLTTAISNVSDTIDLSDYATNADVEAKYTKPASGIPKTDLASAVQVSLGKAETAIQSLDSCVKTENVATTVASGNTNPVTSDAVFAKLNEYAKSEDISSVYKYRGTFSSAATTPSAVTEELTYYLQQTATGSGYNTGDVINVANAFVTNSSFLEGAGNTYAAGTNIACVKNGDTIQWDVLGGSITVDLSGYATTSSVNAKYTKPSTGIPKTDLAADVQTSLGKADTALQSHQSLSNYLTTSTASATYLPKNQGSSNVGKMLVVGTDGNITLMDIPESSSDITGTIDENNNIILAGDLSDGTYTLKYKKSDNTYINTGSLVVSNITYYNISTTLSNCTASGASSIRVGDTTVITVKKATGYHLPDSITVTGATYTWTKSNGQILLSNPTGDISITVTAIENSDEYTNVLTSDDYTVTLNKRYSSSSQAYTDCAGMMTIDFPIASVLNKTIRVKGFTADTTNNGVRIVYIKEDLTSIGNPLFWGLATEEDSTNNIYSVTINETTLPGVSNAAHVFISLLVSTESITSLPNTFIMTIDEEIV